MRKHLGIILSKSPYGTSFTHETLEVVLAAGIYGLSPTVFFIGDGVFQRLKGQSTQTTGQKNLAKQMAALDFYGIEHCVVCEKSMQVRGLKPDGLVGSAVIANPQRLRDLLEQQDSLLSF